MKRGYDKKINKKKGNKNPTKEKIENNTESAASVSDTTDKLDL